MVGERSKIHRVHMENILEAVMVSFSLQLDKT